VARDALANLQSMSVIIPAFNEEDYLDDTLDRLGAAERFLRAKADSAVQILVVDNSSTDRTAAIARDRGLTVINEPDHQIAKVRNAGARAADHDILIFVDADTLVPPALLVRVAEAMADPSCAGGAVDAVCHPGRSLLKVYLRVWRAVGAIAAMAQGACQFCRREVFFELGGYGETLFMGEDIDFYWRLRTLARQRKLRTCFIRDIQVAPSARRFDRWPLWRTLVWTNPLVVMALRRRRSSWTGWYHDTPR
jgi:glycosyltransferase involved in cell wall biosynthesis